MRLKKSREIGVSDKRSLIDHSTQLLCPDQLVVGDFVEVHEREDVGRLEIWLSKGLTTIGSLYGPEVGSAHNGVRASRDIALAGFKLVTRGCNRSVDTVDTVDNRAVLQQIIAQNKLGDDVGISFFEMGIVADEFYGKSWLPRATVRVPNSLE